MAKRCVMPFGTMRKSPFRYSIGPKVVSRVPLP
jgi:hypothetical protein